MSGLFSAMDVSASAMTAQRRRLELLVANLANSQTTRTPEGGPFKRQDVVFASRPMQSFDEILLEIGTDEALEGVEVQRIVTDQSDPVLRHQPGHPDADENGYVAYPNINPLQEMANLMASVRSFQSNVRAFEALKEIVQRSLEIGA